MSQISVSTEQIDGLEVVRVASPLLSLALMPELGGKISSLRDLRSGREWLWRHPRLPYARVPADASYVREADTGGWDECFPTVAPCPYPAAPWAGAPIPDHGELWSQPVRLTLRVEHEAVTLVTTWQGGRLPYCFERRLTLAAGSARLRCDYSVRNTARAPLPFIWCAHPLLAIEPGMRVRLPADARFNVWAASPPGLVGADAGLPFPPAARAGGRQIDLDPLPADPGVALKLWSDPLSEGWAAVEARDGALRMAWDVERLPQVALWMNLGAWAADGGAPYYNLGLEPCIGAQDSLAEAVAERNLYATVPPRATRSWWLEVELSA